MSINLKTLVLNAQYTPKSLIPLYTISSEEAIQRVLGGAAELVASYPHKILTPSRNDLYWPAVIAYKSAKSLNYRTPTLKRSNLLLRDHHKCQYCFDDLTIHTITTDHVLPESKGGKFIWDNVVASCVKCNRSKGDKLPLGKWMPKRAPFKPSHFDLIEERKKYPITVAHESWLNFIPEWKGPVNIIDPTKYHTSEPYNTFNCEAA